MKKSQIIILNVFIFLIASCTGKGGSTPHGTVFKKTDAYVFSVKPTVINTPSITILHVLDTSTITSSSGSTTPKYSTATFPPTKTPIPAVPSSIKPTFTSSVPIITITPSQLIPTSTPKPTQTPNIPQDVVKDECLEVTNSLPPDTSVNGIVVLRNDNNKDVYLLNIHNHSTITLPRQNNQEFEEIFVSPNRKWLAGTIITSGDIITKSILVLNTNGVLSNQVPVPEGFRVNNWINDDNLVLSPSTWDGQSTRPLTLMDPFTGKVKSIDSSFPDIDIFSPVLWGFYSGATRTIFDPDLEYALYPRFGIGVVLWGVRENKEITEFQTRDLFGKNPEWSPDGKLASLVADVGEARESIYYRDEFFLISKDGLVKQLTRMAEYYYSISIVQEYSWSPDGHFIAFSMSFDPDPYKNQQLATVDTLNGQVTNYCHLGNYVNFNTPIWSPDGNYLIVKGSDQNGEVRNSTILISISQGWATSINNNVTPVGWMASP